ncbi:MAG TPA: deoxyribonuclease IV [Thermomicrobiales bacterium]|nr:deoxyribonuclease IV [Thermomicrobiales bacterium]
MQLGAHMSIAGGVHLALERAAEIQMTACQIFTKNDRQWVAKPLDPDNIRRFREQREALGFNRAAIISHASYLINLASPDDLLWHKSMEAFQDELERCRLLDVPYLVVHPGAHVGSGTEVGVRRVAAALDAIHHALPDNQTMTLLETTAGQGTTLGASFDEIAAIMAITRDQELVGVCLDTCHVFAAGYDLREPEGYATTMESFDRSIGLERLRAIHVNDSKHPAGSRKDRHQHIGQGEIGLEGFRSVVNDPRLRSVPALLETEKGDNGEHDVRNLATLRGLIGHATPEVAPTS